MPVCEPTGPAVDELHEALFGWRPRSGLAHERLTPILLAILGWQDLAQETANLTVDWRTQHLLDVTVHEPLGEVRHLLAECRDWCKVVDRSTIDELAGLRSQVGADVVAAITTSGFTDSARLRAAQDGVALICLRPFRGEDANRFIKRVEMTFAFHIPVYSDFDIELISDRGSLRGTQFQIAFDDDHHLLALDGSPAETASEILCASEAPAKEGVFRQRATFRNGRLLQVLGDSPIAISALGWTETVHRATHTASVEMQGAPAVVVERLGDDRAIRAERIVLDDDLYAWQVDGQGEVINRGPMDVRSARAPRRRPEL